MLIHYTGGLFMNNVIKYPFALALLGVSMLPSASQAFYQVWYVNDPFFDTGCRARSWLQELDDFHQQSIDAFKHFATEHGPSKEEREALKADREKLAKIKYTVTEDGDKATIQLNGFENLDKKDIEKIVKKDDGWAGTIVTKEGKVKFFIGQDRIVLSRQVEVKKETKDQKDGDKEAVTYTSSMQSDLEYFKSLLDIATAKVEPIKDNKLTIVIQKQKEETLAIP